MPSVLGDYCCDCENVSCVPGCCANALTILHDLVVYISLAQPYRNMYIGTSSNASIAFGVGAVEDGQRTRNGWLVGCGRIYVVVAGHF